MSVAAGMLNRRVTVYRRAPMPASGTLRGGFLPAGREHWAGYRPRSATEFRIGGMQFHGETGVVTLRDNPETRGLVHHDRVSIDGRMFEIVGQQHGEIVDGILRFDVRTAVTAQSYEEQLNGPRAQVVTLRRVQVGGGFATARARAIVAGYQPEEIAGGIQFGERRVLLSARDLVPANWSPRISVNDKILQHGDTRSLNVLAFDDETHRIGGELMMYEIRASGG